MRVFIACIAFAITLVQSAYAQSSIRLGAENSTVTSGLMDFLIPKFTAETGISVNVVSVGTGAALEGARNGQFDAIITASPHWESIFMGQGFGEQRYALMKTNLVLAGPQSDPAGLLEETGDLNTVLKRLFRGGNRNNFVSLGDNSAVDMKEKELWLTAGYRPTKAVWYRQTQSDSLQALNTAQQLNGYLIVDRPTLLKHQDSFSIRPVYSRPPLIDLDYSVITASIHKHPSVNRVDATKLAYWLTSNEGQNYIRSYTPGNTMVYHPTAAVN